MTSHVRVGAGDVRRAADELRAELNSTPAAAPEGPDADEVRIVDAWRELDQAVRTARTARLWTRIVVDPLRFEALIDALDEALSAIDPASPATRDDARARLHELREMLARGDTRSPAEVAIVRREALEAVRALAILLRGAGRSDPAVG